MNNPPKMVHRSTVKETTKNFYKVHRILTPDGKVFKFEQNNKAESPLDGGVTDNSSLATSTESASNNIVPQASENATQIEDLPIREDFVQQSSEENVWDMSESAFEDAELNNPPKMVHRSTKAS